MRRTRLDKTTLAGVIVSAVVQVVGSLLILAGFTLAQWGVLGPTTLRYLALNAVGSAVLALNAWFERQWGFLLLEGVWAVVSVVGLVRVSTRRPRRPVGSAGGKGGAP